MRTVLSLVASVSRQGFFFSGTSDIFLDIYFLLPSCAALMGKLRAVEERRHFQSL